MELTLNIYSADKKSVEKTYNAETMDLMFGTVITLMELLKIEDMEKSTELLKAVGEAWGEIIKVLGEVFPEATREDWNHVKVNELIPLVVQIAKHVVVKAVSIPNNSKN